MDFIKYGSLYVEIPMKKGADSLEVVAILSLKIEEEIDKHSMSEIEVLIDNKDDKIGIEFINKIDDSKSVKVVHKVDESLNLLFIGVIKYKNIINNGKEAILKLSLHSKSIELDIKKRSRSFQDESNTYKNLFEEIVEENYGQVSDTLSKGFLQESFLIQYDETNWAFLKRCVSNLKGNIVVNSLRDKPYVHIGILEGETYALDSEDYKTAWEGEEFLKCETNFSDYKYHDKFNYEVISIYNFTLMDNVFFKDYTFKIYKKSTIYENGIVKFIYRLRHKPAFKTTPIANELMIGLKLYGKVIDVKLDRVKIHLNIDEKQDKEKAYWFKMSTIYPENTGFYVMPEIGSNVMLEVTNKYGDEAFVKNIVRIDGEINLKTQNPDTKYFGNTSGKEIRLSKNDMQFTEKELHNVLNLKTNKGITIMTSANAKIVMDKGSFDGKKIQIKSNGEIIFATPGASVWIRDGKIDMKALTNIDYKKRQKGNDVTSDSFD